MSLKIGPFHLLSVKCHSLREGCAGGFTVIDLFHSNKVINVFSARKLVTRLLGVHSYRSKRQGEGGQRERGEGREGVRQREADKERER